MEVPLRGDHLHRQAGSGDMCLAPLRGRRRTVQPHRRVREDRRRKGREEARPRLDQLPGKVQAPPAGQVGACRRVHPGRGRQEMGQAREALPDLNLKLIPGIIPRLHPFHL